VFRLVYEAGAWLTNLRVSTWSSHTCPEGRKRGKTWERVNVSRGYSVSSGFALVPVNVPA
jgi:hypothetical protein